MLPAFTVVAAATVAITVANPIPASASIAVSGSPAVARMNPHTELIVSRMNDGRILYNVGSLQYGYTGWAEIPGNGRTPFDPAVEYYPGSGKLVVAVVGSGGDGIWLQSYHPDTRSWETHWSKIPTGGTFAAAPALAVSHLPGTDWSTAELYVYGVTGDGRVWEQTWSEHFWFWRANWTQVPGDSSGTPAPKTQVAVAAEWIEQDGQTPFPRLYLTLRGDDQRLYYITKVYDQWASSWSQIPGNGLTNHAPHMAPIPGELTPTGAVGGVALVVRGLDGKVAYQTLQQNSWDSGWKYLTYACCTPVGPAIDYNWYATVYTVGSDGAIWGQNLTPYDRDLQPSSSLPGWRKVPGSEPYDPAPPPPTTPPTTVDLALDGNPTYDSGTKEITVRFKNQGSANAGSFMVQMTFDGYVLFQKSYPGMAAGQGDVAVFDANDLPPRTYNFQVVLDVYGTVAESNEDNNEYHTYFTR